MIDKIFSLAAGKAVTAAEMPVVTEAAQVATEAVMVAVVPALGVHPIHQHDSQHLHVVVSVILAVSMAVADAAAVVEAVVVVLAVEDTKVNSNFHFYSPLIGQPIRN